VPMRMLVMFCHLCRVRPVRLIEVIIPCREGTGTIGFAPVTLAQRHGRLGMARARLSVDIDADLKKRIKLAAVSNDQSVREWIEQTLTEVLDRQKDRGWMESDLSRLDEIEPYEFAEGDMDKGDPVRYVPGIGFIVVEEAAQSGE
jgi:hypothetical protein